MRIDTTGRRKVEEIDSAKAFFQQQFPDLIGQMDVPDAMIQRRLLHLLYDGSAGPSGDGTHLMAERCLRCFICSQIELVCIQLEAQFGSEHGFTRYDLFPYVLDEVREAKTQVPSRFSQSSYRSFASEVLQTFDSERASLATWTIRLVKHHRELNTFLLQHGVYMVSDWAILNDTTSKQLQRIFAEFHTLTPVEIQHANILLESYHGVYRRDRLKQRQTGTKGQCLPPTVEQLHQIAHLLNQKGNLTLSPEDIMTQLKTIAERLRQYRIYVRGGTPATESLDRPETQVVADRLQSSDSMGNLDDQDKQTEFLTFYRQQFVGCLDQAVEQVTGDRFGHLQRKNPEMAQQFLSALQLFHCQGRSMGEIAPLVGLQAQYQVTRLLKLKEFRADIRQQMLKALRDRTLEKARTYADPNYLQKLDQQVEVALDEQITAVMQEAETEASIAKNRSSSSLLAQQLCRHLDTRRSP